VLLIFPLVACSSNPSSTEPAQPVDTVTVIAAATVAAGPTSLPATKPVHASSTPEPTSSPLVAGPLAASFVAVSPDGNVVAAINPDSGSVTLVDAVNLAVKAEVPVGDDPRTLCFTPDSKKIVVSNWGSASISVISIDRGIDAEHHRVGLMPYGVVTDGESAFITEFAAGNVSIFNLKTGRQVNRIPVNPFPAGLAISSDRKQLLVTHLFSGDVTSIDVKTSKVSHIVLTGSDISSNQFVAIGPSGNKAYLPQTRSNVDNTALLFDSTVFPVVNILDLPDLKLLIGDRITIDTADEPVNMPFSVAISPDENIVFIANAGSDDVSVIDQHTDRGLAHISVGSNPRGVAITPDGSRVFVNNVLDGTLSVIDTDDLVVTHTVDLTDMPLPETILRGKKIFNSASEPLLTTDNWISCATCHFDGMMDGRTWLGFPDGPRNTPSLLGVSRTLPIHWSGDLDELQDVEMTIREIQFGNGLINGEAHDTLGVAHTGTSSQLDALASYLAVLQFPISPQTVDATDLKLGRQTFTSLECGRCHVPPIFTDRELHEVGTGDELLEKNSHGRGTNFDTPSLIGVWMTAPYFHDGSAQTLEDVFRIGTVHNVFEQLSAEELGSLIGYMKALPMDD
jgi:YVTN family beta-propeller protein